MKWMKKTFEEVVLFARTGLNPRQNFKLGQGNNNYITIKNIKNNSLVIDDNTDVVDDEAIKLIHKRSQIKKGDVLFASIGRMGDMFIIEEEPIGWDINESVFAFTLNTNIVKQKYFYYIFRVKSTLDYLISNSSGSTFKSIKMNQLKKMVFDIPQLEEQDYIISVLDKVCDVIEKRKQELEFLDNLIKARFVEMFGDPIINSFGWKIVNIFEVVGGKVSNGFFSKRDDYCDDGNVSVLGVANIVNRMYSKVDELPKTNADLKDIEKYEVKYGDMLFCRSSLVAEGIGKASIVPEGVHDRVLFECHVIRLPLDLDKCVPEFMQTLSTMDFFRNQVIAQSKTATMTTIGQDGILKSNIILPPIEKQREFYDFIKQVDKSKVAVQKTLDETKLLFDSLMQKYFG